MGLARELAQRIADFSHGELSQDALYWGRIAVLDIIGVTLAGALEDAPRLDAKFHDCATRVLGPDAADALGARIGSLDTLGSVRELTELIASAGAGERKAGRLEVAA